MSRERTWEEETLARIERAKVEQGKAKEAYQYWAACVDALERALQAALVKHRNSLADDAVEHG